MKVKTTPGEIAQYKAIKAMKLHYYDLVTRAQMAQREAYQAENRPMSGGVNTPDLFAPKSAKIIAADNALKFAMEQSANFLKSIGAKRRKRLHQLQLAGLI